MATEFEAKFYPVDKEEYRKKLLSIGAKLTIAERKMLRLVADRGDNPVLSKHHTIRIRDEGNLIRLSLKVKPDETGKLSDQKEVDVEVSDFEKTKEILEEVGLVFGRRQETLREEWEYKGAQITIDTWPCLEPYSEVEARSEEKVKEIAEELGFDWDKKIIIGASQLIGKVYGLQMDEVMKLVSNLNFENNPFKDMKKVWP